MALKLVVEHPSFDQKKPPNNDGKFSPTAIVARIKSGDRTAESEMVTFYSDELMFILSRKFSDKELCLDTHQDTFAMVIQKIRNDELRDPSKLASFIRSTAINLALMSIRKHKKMIALSDSPVLENLSGGSNSAYQDIAQEELTDILMTLINELGVERDKLIIISFYITQLDKSQICQQLDLSPDHFDKIIYRAKQRLKRLILSRNKGSLFTTIRQWITGSDKGEFND